MVIGTDCTGSCKSNYHTITTMMIPPYNMSLYQRLSRACIVHLVIKRTNWSYVKTMSCSGSHLGITINIKNTKFVKDLPMIDAQFRFNQCNSFREEYISVFSSYGPVLILHRCQPLFGAISNKKLRCQ